MLFFLPVWFLLLHLRLSRQDIRHVLSLQCGKAFCLLFGYLFQPFHSCFRFFQIQIPFYKTDCLTDDHVFDAL